MQSLNPALIKLDKFGISVNPALLSISNTVKLVSSDINGNEVNKSFLQHREKLNLLIKICL